MAVSRPGRSRAAVLPFPRTAALSPVSWRRVLPSGRVLLAGFALLVVGALLYLGARETSVFALRTIAVTGAPPRVQAHVHGALRPLEGKSLLAVHGADIRGRLERLPDVASVSYDRDFPHTLRLVVTPAHSIAVLRRGASAWILSSSGRVVRTTGILGAPRLPRIWVPRATDVQVGTSLANDDGTQALRALAASRSAGFGERIAAVRADEGLTFVLASGLEIRFGSDANLGEKLAVVRAILPQSEGFGYLDVSAPARPVGGGNPKVKG